MRPSRGLASVSSWSIESEQFAICAFGPHTRALVVAQFLQLYLETGCLQAQAPHTAESRLQINATALKHF